MRHWNLADLNENEERLLDVWLNLVDENSHSKSIRTKLTEEIEWVERSFEENNFGTIIKKKDTIYNILNKIPGDIFEEEIKALKLELEKIVEIQSDRESIKEAFQNSISIDKSEIYRLNDYFVEEKTVNDLKSSIYSQAVNRGDEILLDTISPTDRINNLSRIRLELSSKKSSLSYNIWISDELYEFVEEQSEIERDKLEFLVKELFAELRQHSWKKKDFENVIQDYVAKPEINREDRLEKFLNQLQFKSEPLNCYVPLRGVSVSKITPIDVGEVTIHSVNDDDFDIFERMDPNFKFLDIENVSETWVETNTEGATPGILIRNLRNKVLRAIDVLNFSHQHGLISPPFSGSFMVLRESPDGVFPLRKEHDLDESSSGEFLQKETTEKRISYFNNYLRGESDTNLDESITNSIRWYSYAQLAQTEEEQFLNHVISIESLLVGGFNESKSSNIVYRAVEILQFHASVREEYSDFFGRVYDLRSKIVHTGSTHLPELDTHLDRIEDLNSKLIASVVDYQEDCSTIVEVVDQIHKQEKENREDLIKRSPFSLGEPFDLDCSFESANATERARVSLDGEFTDDGKYVYFEADINYPDGQSLSSVKPRQNYKVRFDFEGTEYIGENVVFPDYDTTSKKSPERVRWYSISATE